MYRHVEMVRTYLCKTMSLWDNNTRIPYLCMYIHVHITWQYVGAHVATVRDAESLLEGVHTCVCVCVCVCVQVSV